MWAGESTHLNCGRGKEKSTFQPPTKAIFSALSSYLFSLMGISVFLTECVEYQNY